MVDFKATMQLVKQAFVEPEKVWAETIAENPPVRAMLERLVVPWVLVCAAIGLVLALVFLGKLLSTGFLIRQVVVEIIFDVGIVFLLAFIADFFSGVFGGQRSFEKAFGMAALVLVPSILSSSLLAIPSLGGLLSLGLGIYSLYLLYKAIPLFLGVPEDKRLVHFLSVFGCMILVGFLSTGLLGAIAFSSYAMQ